MKASTLSQTKANKYNKHSRMSGSGKLPYLQLNMCTIMHRTSKNTPTIV